MTYIHCNICGSNDACIRKDEIETAKITMRAHVDCDGHSQYRVVSSSDIARSEQELSKRGDNES